MAPTSLPQRSLETALQRCLVAFDATAAHVARTPFSATLNVAVPHLEGEATEFLLADGALATADLRNVVLRSTAARRSAGLFVADAADDLETAARRLYAAVFAAAAGQQLYRIWNYVPQINAEEHGLENYRRFCRGRAQAFEARFGHGFERRLPAASGVGAQHGPLAIAFLAGDAPARHFENPQQIPAFAYPPEYGPRSPSFSRATLVEDGPRRTLFISGTAAIRGHATMCVGDLAGQLAGTRENLHAIATAAGAGAEFGRADRWQRTLKVYVRHAADLAVVRADLEQHLLGAEDAVTYLQADLCRSDLLVEIEAVLTK